MCGNFSEFQHAAVYSGMCLSCWRDNLTQDFCHLATAALWYFDPFGIERAEAFAVLRAFLPETLAGWTVQVDCYGP